MTTPRTPAEQARYIAELEIKLKRAMSRPKQRHPSTQEVLNLLNSGHRPKEITKRTGKSATAISHIKKTYDIETHLFVVHPDNEVWVHLNKPEDSTMSDFLNSIITDARLEEE